MISARIRPSLRAHVCPLAAAEIDGGQSNEQMVRGDERTISKHLSPHRPLPTHLHLPVRQFNRFLSDPPTIIDC
jgi:hypothetical protein